jgi:hypothetical protein
MEEICAMRILIVDTDVIVLERLELFLNTISHNSVKTACSGRFDDHCASVHAV